MGIDQKITSDNYMQSAGGQVVRIWPIDRYAIPSRLTDRASEYHILKVPLLGQHYAKAGGTEGTGAQDWCGRTAASMTYNWYQLLEGGDPKARYISHWGQDRGYYLDLRLPTGSRAFHQKPDDPPFNEKVSGVKVGAGLEEVLQCTSNHLNAYPSSEKEQRDRYKKAEEIAESKPRVERAFKPMLDVLRGNNPVVFFSGFSTSDKQRDSAIHIILLTGYAYLPDTSGAEDLWLMVANPATFGNLVRIDASGIPPLLVAPSESNDLAALERLGPQHNLIRLDHGDWTNARAALGLIRARRLFQPNERSIMRYDLLMDYWAEGTTETWGRGGLFYYRDTPIEAPPEAVETSLRDMPVTFPFDGAGDAPSPVRYLFLNEKQPGGGYYPLGLHQNLHSGVHLRPLNPPGPLAPVRCLAPGYVVATRLSEALPAGFVNAGDNEGAEKRALVQEIAQGSNAFVLVRHVLDEIPDENHSGVSKTFTFYTLYMHLASPDWSQDEIAAEYAKVPWLNALVRRRNGTVIAIDPVPPTTYLPTTKPEETVLRGQTLGIIGATFVNEEKVDLHPNEPNRTVAVWQAPEGDVTEALDALASGKVLTFCRPSIVVGRGEALGYVQAADEGFLHWEILAPAGEPHGLEALLDFATEKLGLGADTFKRFQEKTENNFFDPADGELAELLGMLPDDDGDKEGKLDPEYDPSELVSLYQGPEGLVFTPGLPVDPQGTTGREVYPLKIALEDFRGAMPAGPQKLTMRFDPPDLPAQTVTFDPKKDQLEVQVPAAARKIIFETADCYIEIGSTRTTPEEDGALLRRLAGARLRQVVLAHLNGWSKEGLLAEMKARFESDDSELTPYAEATAFWAHDEVSVVGEDGNEKKLFADAPGEDQLAAKTKLAHAHPVIVGWLLGLLVKHNIARFRDEFPPVQGAQAVEKLLYLGWTPTYAEPRPRRVGDLVHAVAVASAPVEGAEALALQARIAGADAPIVIARRRYREGVIAEAVNCPFWGLVTLEVASQSPEVGQVALEVLVPELGVLGSPVKDRKAGTHTLTLHFTANPPVAIDGFVVMETWTVEAGATPEGQGSEASVSIPIQARRALPAQTGNLQYDETGQFIVAAKDGKKPISTNFAFSEYHAKRTGTEAFRVSRALVDLVQSVRTAYEAAQKKATATVADRNAAQVTLVAIAADGLSVRLKCSSDKKGYHARLAAAATECAKTPATAEDLGDEVRLTAPPPADDAPLVATFDASEAYGKLVAEASLGPTQELHVRFGVCFQNGGRLARVPTSDQAGKGTEDVTRGALRRTAPSGVLEAWEAAPSVKLRKAQFGAIRTTVQGSSLILSAALHGDAKDWAAAKPAFVYKDKDGKEKTLGDKSRNDNLLTATIASFGDKSHANAKLRFEARVTNPNALFNGEKIAIEPVSLDYDTTPRLEKPRLTWTATDLEVRCMALAFPTFNVLELGVYKLGATGEEDTLLGRVADFDNKNPKGAKYAGAPDGQGLLVGRIGRAAVAKSLAEGDRIRVELRRSEGNEKVLETKIKAVSAETTVPAA
ncbi:hypothetical protein [Chondromyces apiculatus]|uniref:Uncharacterized protein n=1 Tax=Chondromyces apiculatus DSM 436 TaxID=1192034 RepID=A0A017T2T7_9BACT|nr:hypothetical protein [Chondromyces apiculatus]EYF02881.1 Hypothetical protein CAP_6461 [Chondromyces apiculatus DSM 436]